MGRRAQKITVTTIGTPPLEGAEAFARWMAEVLNKQPSQGPNKTGDSKVASEKNGGNHGQER